MIELNSDGVDETRARQNTQSGSVQSKIEHAIRAEMRRVRELAPESASTLKADLISTCREAHCLHMSAESLVITIKNVWQRIPEARSFARPLGVDSILSQSVTIALDEFYNTPLTSPPLAE